MLSVSLKSSSVERLVDWNYTNSWYIYNWYCVCVYVCLQTFWLKRMNNVYLCIRMFSNFWIRCCLSASKLCIKYENFMLFVQVLSNVSVNFYNVYYISISPQHCTDQKECALLTRHCIAATIQARFSPIFYNDVLSLWLHWETRYMKIQTISEYVFFT